MRRNPVAPAMMAIVLGIVPACLECAAVGQVGAATVSSTLSSGPPVLRESFDDNARGFIWGVYTDDANTAWVTEVNQRLEFRTKAETSGALAAYVSNGWRLIPTQDFSMKVDLYYNLVNDNSGWISFGLTPNAASPRQQYVCMGIGCTSRYVHYWYEKRNGYSMRNGFTSRLVNSVTVYLSYDASQDTLYIGDTGYGPEDAWMTFTGLIQGDWGGAPLFVYLGGSADGIAVGPGQAFADNLLVESGEAVETSLREVYRFWSPVLGKHFYTISKREKEKLLTQYAHVWTYEGPVFRAFLDASDSASRPVHRFWSSALGSHFYTIEEYEKDKLLGSLVPTWTYEGVAFYAYPKGLQPTWARPVHRFWSESKQSHFYTISEAEKAKLLTLAPDRWKYEGVAWYAIE